MSLFGNIFDFAKDSIGELASHPLQTAGAALGVPGYDPFFGGLFNNRPGGALLSPTGNFTSSAWQDMYRNNPGDAGGLNLFHGINAIADKVAPAVAGYFAGPAMAGAMGGGMGAGAGSAAGSAGATDAAIGAGADAGTAAGSGAMGTTTGAGAGTGTGALTGGQHLYGLFGMGGMNGAGAGSGVGATAGTIGGASGLTGLFQGPAALGDTGLTNALSAGGSGMAAANANMGAALGSSPTGLFSGLLPGGGMSGTASGALGGGMSGQMAGAAPLGSSTMGGMNFDTNAMLQNGARIMQMRNQQQQPQQQMVMPAQNGRAPSVQRPVMPIGPSMPYATFNGGGLPMNQFGIGSAYGSV